MKANLQILIICKGSSGSRFSNICKKMKWNSGTIGVVLRRLVKSGYLQRIERGIYKTTKEGIEYIHDDVEYLIISDLDKKLDRIIELLESQK